MEQPGDFTDEQLDAICEVYSLLIELAQKARKDKAMDKITLTIGSVQTSASGTATRDTRREVQFDGEKLAEYHEAGTGRDGNPTDTRGTVETLYRASDGRLVAHVHDWSHWQGEPDTWRLYEVNEADLSGRGRFAELGHEAGYGRALTLDEALTPLERFEYDDPEPVTYTLREAQEGEHVLEINVMVHGDGDALDIIEGLICDGLNVGGLHAQIEKALVGFVKAQGFSDLTGAIRVYNVNSEQEHYDPEHDNTKPDGPRCERCGRRLPSSTSPYHQHEGGPPVYLCEDCASCED